MHTASLLLSLTLTGIRAEASPYACAASTDRLVRVMVLEPRTEVIARAITKWARWIEKRKENYCFSVILSPTLGTDAEPIVAPLLLLFRLPDVEVTIPGSGTNAPGLGRPVA